jgi:hypothetical protein
VTDDVVRALTDPVRASVEVQDFDDGDWGAGGAHVDSYCIQYAMSLA